MKTKVFAISLALMFAVVLSGCFWAPTTPKPIVSEQISATDQAKVTGILKAHFIDVGQGDSIFIDLPNGQAILIDAGKNEYGSSIVSYLRGLDVSKIDYIIATHPDADHISGLDTVIENFEIGSVYMPDIINNTKTFEDVLSSIARKGLKIKMAQAGTAIIDTDNLKVVFVAPVAKSNDTNNMSAVLKITYGGTSFLFAGDAEKESEQEMLNSGVNLRSDVLKVGHHGSASSSTDAFIKAVSPKYAVISCGKGNSYGHPSDSVLQTLTKYSASIYRTDELGTIIVESDGTSIILDKNASVIQPNAPPDTSAISAQKEKTDTVEKKRYRSM